MSIFLLVATTHFIALLSPGPDFFLIVTTLLSNGYRAAYRVCLGIAVGNAVILLLILYALHQLGGLDPNIVQVVKYCAAVYLLYLALRCFMALRSTHSLSIAADTQIQLRSITRYFYLGLQSSLFNPKNIIFYSSVLLLVETQFNLYQQLGLTLWMVAVVYFWNCLLIKLLSRASYLEWLQAKVRWIYSISGICFLSFALSTIFLLE